MIEFTGSGESHSVDSVEVYNLTQETYLELGGTDTIYFVNDYAGIISYEQNNSDLYLFPNPMNQTCKMRFTTETDGTVYSNIYDLQGRNVFSISDYLTRGTHTYIISGIKTGTYIVNVTTNNIYLVNRLVSVGSQQNQPSIKKSLEKQDLINFSKSTKEKSTNTFEMEFSNNDIILFIGKSGNYGRVISKVITSDDIIDFYFIQCTDADSNHYKVLTVGQQTWMLENLSTTKYLNGSPINNDSDNSTWNTTTNGSYVWYNNDLNNKDTYGALYNWLALQGDSICPYGWKVPTYSDWVELISSVGGVSLAGGRLKQTTTDFWMAPNTGATNEYGFTALPSGFRNKLGLFDELNYSGKWWTLNSENPDSSYYWSIDYQSEYISEGLQDNKTGYALRCILNCTNPDINLGADIDICKVATEITLDAYASNYSSLQWSTNGDGTFGSPNDLYTNYNFGSGDYAAGIVSLVLTAQPINFCGVEISDTMHITLTPQPEVDAAMGQHYCPGDAVDLHANASNYSEVEWISLNGFGSIEDDSDLNTVYYPGELDWLRGHTDFIIRVTAIPPCTDVVEDFVRIYFHELPEVDGGGDQLELPGSPTKLWATEPPDFHTGVWSMVGTGGSFTDPTNHETMFSALVGAPYTLIWKVTDTITGCINTDTIIVEFNAPVPEANIPCPGIETITDSDGNEYNTVKIGSQCWMKENLRTTSGLNHYTAEEQDLWTQYNYEPWLSSPAYCWYNDDQSTNEPCGALYNWNAVNTGTLCPSGWKVPTVSDFQTLQNFLTNYDTPAGNEGGKLKDTTSAFWVNNVGATNISGFTGFGCGQRTNSTNPSHYPYYQKLNENAFFWASDIDSNNDYVGYNADLSNNNAYFVPGYSLQKPKNYALSVRCLKEGGYSLEVLEVLTGEVTQIKPNSAKCGGVVTQMGEGGSIIKAGLVWARQPNPTLIDNDGSSWNISDLGSLSHNMLNLDPDTVYYVRAYVVNNVQDTAYGVIKEFNTKIPSVHYHSVTNITSTTALSGGTVVDNGGSEATVRGLIWSNNSNLTINNYLGIEVEGSGFGTYQCALRDLTPNTTYYVRAFARNVTGVGYGDIQTFHTLPPGIGDACPGVNSLIDPRDGNEYGVVHMGSKCWMAENLRYLPEVHPINDNTTSGFRYYISSYYGTDTAYAKTTSYYQNYGVLYNFLAAMNACPPGWSLPSKADWDDMVISIVNTTGFSPTVGVELKSCRSVNSILPAPCNTNTHPRWNWTNDPGLYYGSDNFGFGLLPGGYLIGESGNSVIMIGPGGNAKFWTSTDNGANSRTVEFSLLQLGYRTSQNVQWNGLNVRCVKN
jgi:uncharacterized protein (TIGR02145 family)